MNFADNGRHLADQDYTICMRQEVEMCSIAYEPCYENSFRIGPPPEGLPVGIINPGAAGTPGGVGTPIDPIGEASVQEPTVAEQEPESQPVLEEVAGSGDGPVQAESRMTGPCNDRIIMPCDSDDLITVIISIGCNFDCFKIL